MAIMKKIIGKGTRYKKAVAASHILDDYILELMQLEGFDSKSKEFLALSEAYSHLQYLQGLLSEAKEEAGFGDE